MEIAISVLTAHFLSWAPHLAGIPPALTVEANLPARILRNRQGNTELTEKFQW
jgi:hypothetical protein